MSEEHTYPREQVEALITRNKKLANENEQLRFELSQLKRMLFGTKSERFVPEAPAEQMNMVFSGEVPDPSPGDQQTEQIPYQRKTPKKKKQPARHPLPEHLERRDTVLEPEGDTTGMKRLGEEVSEEWEYAPGQLSVHRIIRPKDVDPDHEDNGVMIADDPSRPIDKGIAGPGLLSRVLTDKYLDHLPLYRQAKRFKREAIPLPRSTLGDWVRQCADLLSPLYEQLKEKTLAAEYLQGDESGIRVLTKDQLGSLLKGCMLVHSAPVKCLCLFKYTRTKEKVRILEALRSYSGSLQVDGNVSYPEKGQQADVTLLNCWTHARRTFDQALDNDKALTCASADPDSLGDRAACPARTTRCRRNPHIAPGAGRAGARTILSMAPHPIRCRAPSKQYWQGHQVYSEKTGSTDGLYNPWPIADRQQSRREPHPAPRSWQEELSVCRVPRTQS